MLLGMPLLFAYLLVLLFYIIAYSCNLSSRKRSFLELHTGFCCIALGYDNWIYLLVFAFFSLGDILKMFPASNGLLWIYIHVAISLAMGSLPVLVLFPSLLFFGRIRRLYEKENIASTTLYTLKQKQLKWDYLI